MQLIADIVGIPEQDRPWVFTRTDTMMRAADPRAGIDAHAEIDRDLGRSLDAAVARGDRARPLYALPTYTALLELRDVLAERGVAQRWSE